MTLTARQRDHFVDEGYLVVEDLVDVGRYLEPMVVEYGEHLDRLARDLHAEGRLSSTYDDLSFGPRLTKVYAETETDWAQYFDFSLPLKPDIRPDEPCFFSTSVFEILRGPRAARRRGEPHRAGDLLEPGPARPAQAAGAAAARDDLDAPGVRRTPWHQDASVVVPEADRTEIVTVWIPIFDATEENGCLRVVPRNHRRGLIEHCPTQHGMFLATANFDADRAVALPMRRGSALFMNRNTPHSSLPNNSSEVRWSMDLRYHATGQPTGRPRVPRLRGAQPARSRIRAARRRGLATGWLDARARLAADPSLVGRFIREWDGTGCA